MDNISINNNNSTTNEFKFDTTVNKVPLPNQDTTVVLASKRNSGKSKLVLNLIYNLVSNYSFDYIICFSDTAHFLEDYKFLDKKFIMPLSDEKIIKILNYQEQQTIKETGVKCLMILDDINIEKKSQILNKIFTQGRHVGITVILSVQFPKHVCSKIIRNNIDYLYLSELNNETMYNVIKELITVSGVDNKEIFNFIVNNNHDYQFILYDNTQKDKLKRLSVVKAELLQLQLLDKKQRKAKK